jgi:hypothetical protein
VALALFERAQRVRMKGAQGQRGGGNGSAGEVTGCHPTRSSSGMKALAVARNCAFVQAVAASETSSRDGSPDQEE